MVLGVGVSVAVALALWFSDFAVGAGEEQYTATSAAARARPGDCLTERDLLTPAASTVACDEPHAIEIYARRPALEGEGVLYPVENIGPLGEEMCFAEFEPYVSTPYYDSLLEYITFVPNEQAWTDGQRDIICALYDPENPSLRKTSRGSGR